jgi:hypothetical protein
VTAWRAACRDSKAREGIPDLKQGTMDDQAKDEAVHKRVVREKDGGYVIGPMSRVQWL